MRSGPESANNLDVVESLCAQSSNGDQDALQRLLHLHHDRLLGAIRRKIGPQWQGKIEAEDVLQEAYVDAFAAAKSFQYAGPESFYQWIKQIADHRFFHHVRHWRTRSRDVKREIRTDRTPSSYAPLLERCLADTATPSRIVRKQDAAGVLMGCIARLPEDYRVVVQRHLLRQEPLETVAADLDRTPEAVRRMAYRAVERLRGELGRASQYLSRSG